MGLRVQLQTRSFLYCKSVSKWKTIIVSTNGEKIEWNQVGFEEYLEYSKEALTGFLFKFCLDTHGLFEELDRHAKRGRSQEYPHCGACKQPVQHVFLECASYDHQEQTFF